MGWGTGKGEKRSETLSQDTICEGRAGLGPGGIRKARRERPERQQADTQEGSEP